MKPSEKPVTVPEVISQVARSFDASVLKGWYGSLKEMFPGTKSYYTAVGLFWLLIYASTIIALDAISKGYHNVYGGTREIPWGIMISTYIFFVVISTGLCILSALGHVFGLKNFAPISQRAAFLSMVTICSGFLVILLEVEMPFRMMLYNVLTPNLTSNIWWMGTLYGAYLFFAIVEFALMLMGWYRLAIYFGLIALISDIAANSNLGAIFGMLQGREFWYGPYMPIYFILSATISGCGVIVLFTWLAYKIEGKEMDAPMKRAMESVGKLWALLLAILMFFTTWKIITSFAGGAAKIATLQSFLTGKYAVNFWVFEILLAMVIPFVLLLISKGKNLALMSFAAACMIIGIFIMRFDMVVLGQIVSVYHELGVNEYKDILSYSPSWHEIGIVAGAMGITALTFLLGEKVFKGHHTGDHH